MLAALPHIPAECSFGDVITIEAEISPIQHERIYTLARALRPWRKGPFRLFDILIESEWNSAIKYNLLRPYLNLRNRCVADIGCNNGYYMFRMLAESPRKIVGFDPSPLFMTQFQFIDRFVDSGIVYELLGVEHAPWYEEKFDVIFCLGVLYHRSDPIATLKALKKSLNENGELFLDTFMIEGEEEVALCPQKTYSKIPNVYFIPTIPALRNWCERAGFGDVEILHITKTGTDEQRATDWILGESLEHFLDPQNPDLTVEGYPAPRRVYIKATL